MPDDAREHLEEVRGRLHEAGAGGDDHASELAEHVGAFLDAGATPTADQRDDLLERLREGVRRFEAAHPTLSAAVQGVIDSLTAAGI